MADPSESLVTMYRDAGVSLLPPGRAWQGEKLADVVEGLSVEFARVHEDAETLLKNANPAQASEYLDDWEELLDLPGACVATPPTTYAERQGAIIAKLRGNASHAKSVYEAAAAAMGYTDLEFVHFSPFEVGTSAVGDPVYSDEWMHVVRIYVPVGTQTADDALICTFTDQLRRSHAYLDIKLEGPMGSERKSTSYVSDVASSSLGASWTVATLAAVSVSYSGHVSIQCIIDNGAGAAPSDTPQGSFELYASGDGTNYTLVSGASTELAKIAANGNNVVSAYAILDGVPGTSIKVRYVRTSGGGGNSRLKLRITTW